MRTKRILEHTLFILGTFATCLIILATSDLHAQTLISEKLGLRVQSENSIESSLSRCSDPEISARQGLILVEAILESPRQTAKTCGENPEINSCFPEQFDTPSEESEWEIFLAEVQQNSKRPLITSTL